MYKREECNLRETREIDRLTETQSCDGANSTRKKETGVVKEFMKKGRSFGSVLRVNIYEKNHFNGRNIILGKVILVSIGFEKHRNKVSSGCLDHSF
ncbi:hypothetical protein TNIN_333841 [Trichonephila inaurata madagascariensis]|uniref:Uncharacterized protein n=1 Tax=Trichonephila inaurata madagascariensis TaxID=2747483 RepID=A0A8X6YF22_9ARAC|nr:hypothetical protein TNIN_333841 [Trichonephila inaurata madagascariensis]